MVRLASSGCRNDAVTLMPGIAGITGIIGTGLKEHRKSELADMLRALRRSPLDECGTVIDDRIGLWSGWIQREPAASHPRSMWNKQRDICLMFVGEDYTEPDDPSNLRFRRQDNEPEDGAYLVQRYEEYGLDFLEKLNGTFCGLVIDLRRSKCVLFNDRFGINRIYFHQNESGFYFSSEAKSLLQVIPQVRELDLRGLGEFLSCGCVLQDRTLFRGISLLPGGSAWIFGLDAEPKRARYFSPERWEQQPVLPAPDYYERLKATWKRALPRYFRGRQPVALSLTGGVDSRMILAWAPREAGTLPCYTFGSRYRDCADVKISREVARICGQSHEVIPIDDSFSDHFPDLAERTIHISDGSMDVTGAIDLYVQKRERQIAPVRITGTNGGEILRSLVAFKPTSLCRDVFSPEVDPYFQLASETYADELRGHRLSFTAFKQAPWHMGCKFAVERSDITLRMPYFDNDLIQLVYQAPADCAASNHVSQRLIQDGDARLAGVATDRGGSLEWLPGIAKARQLYQEFTFKAEYAYDYGMPQSLARFDHALAPLRLERLFLGRHKIHHFRVFYRDEQSDYLRDLLLDARTRNRPYLQSRRLVDMIRHHLKGNRNYTKEIHKLLTIELIQRVLIERQ